MNDEYEQITANNETKDWKSKVDENKGDKELSKAKRH